MIEQKNRLTKIDESKLFFPVTLSPLRAIVENEMLMPKDYIVLHHGKRFLGIKPKVEEESSVFYIENKELYEAGKTLSSSISAGMVGTVSYANTRLNKCYFLFEENTEIIEDTPEEGIFDVRDTATLKKLHDFKFNPTIVVENGFDYNDRTVFYLLIGLREDYNIKGFLTIARFKLSSKTVEKIRNGEKSQNLIMNEIMNSCVPQFRDALKEFVQNYEALSEIEANRVMLTAVTLDIFNRNRNIEALKSDKTLLLEILNFKKRAYNFFINDTKANRLLNFIVSYKSLNFEKSTISNFNFREILTEKKAYSNLKRLFSGKNADESERMKYIEEQIRVMKLIPDQT